ncbi:MAG: glutathione S-transferase family protein [Pelagimonas sp.]|jgi:glutathione S-transferase|nr:glutathione S-transferase family protein [Pelagimonas sp.]
MIKIVSFEICPFVQRVTAMLEAKGTPYEITYISLSDKPDWFVDLSPNGQVPLLITQTGTALFESDAIVEYLDEITAPLQADLTAEIRALNRAWCYQASKHYLVQCGLMQSADRATYHERHAKLAKSFARAEAQLGQGPYFSGATLGNIDLAWLPLLHRAELVRAHSGHDMLSGFPKVQAWQQAILATGLAPKTVSEAFGDKFADFYLSERTWLGRGAPEQESCAPGQTGPGCCC